MRSRIPGTGTMNSYNPINPLSFVKYETNGNLNTELHDRTSCQGHEYLKANFAGILKRQIATYNCVF